MAGCNWFYLEVQTLNPDTLSLLGSFFARMLLAFGLLFPRLLCRSRFIRVFHFNVSPFVVICKFIAWTLGALLFKEDVFRRLSMNLLAFEGSQNARTTTWKRRLIVAQNRKLGSL